MNEPQHIPQYLSCPPVGLDESIFCDSSSDYKGLCWATAVGNTAPLS